MSNVDVLLIEDNPSDTILMREAFKDAQVSNTLHVVASGQDALRFLRNDPTLNPRGSAPGLILLDLHLHDMSGQDVLAYVKKSPDLRRIPVIMLTNSQDESDIAQAYDLQANSYVVKPVDFDHLLEATKSIENFWLRTARLPNNDG